MKKPIFYFVLLILILMPFQISIQAETHQTGNISDRPPVESAPNFGSYIAEMQRKIWGNWTRPSGKRIKPVVVSFQINHDGQLWNIVIHKSSGSKSIDQAALDAVRAASPMQPLPANYKGKSVPVQFTLN